MGRFYLIIAVIAGMTAAATAQDSAPNVAGATAAVGPSNTAR